MITNKNTRSYEVSIWTLQDSFITVLKWPNLEHKGLIEEPKMSLKDDSEDSFSFRIPMYIRDKGNRIKNPLWYNTTNGNLIANLRKLKVVFHKHNKEKRKVYEFLITKVTETHKGFETYCEVESEGLAFNELGKIGYKIDLSEDLYLMEYNEWKEKNPILEETEENGCPINNINYWVEKVIPKSEPDELLSWQVEYKMDWSDAISGGIELKSDVIYEDPYNSNWLINNNKIIPADDSFVAAQEKRRYVTSSSSNRYNLTQDIAETFGVFCTYIYEHDEDLHITKKIIRFYNNSLCDNPENIIDFNYYYDTEDISREMDSADQITKMIVLSNTSDADLIDSSITSVDANKSLEDYLLNFDYLYSIDAITKEQYEEVPIFEAKMRAHNEKLMSYSNAITVSEDKLIEAHAQLENMRVIVDEDNARLQEEQAFIKRLLNSDKIDYDNNKSSLSVIGLNPDICIVRTSTINNIPIREIYFSQNCVLNDGKIMLFKTLNAVQDYYNDNEIITENIDIASNGIDYILNEDDDEFIIGLRNLPEDTNIIYAVYNYSPDTYHQKLAQIWEKKLNEDKNKLNQLQDVVDNLHGVRKDNDYYNDFADNEKKGLIQDLYDEYDKELKEKNKDIIAFEKMMGSALREGTWQPEDIYAKYGDKRTLSNLNLNTPNQEIFWDAVLFDNENKNYYEEGVSLEKVYYPCIDLSGLENLFTLSNLNEINQNRENDLLKITDLGFIWDDITVPGMRNYIEEYNSNVSQEQQLPVVNFPYILNIGSAAQLGFLKYSGEEDEYSNGEIIPVLILTGAENYIVPSAGETLTDALKNLNGTIGYITNNIITENVESGQDLTETITKNLRSFTPITDAANIKWIDDSILENFEIVYPRIKISSYNFKNNTDNYKLYVNETTLIENQENITPILLSPYYSYNILNRYDGSEEIDWNTVTVDDLSNVVFSYYINIKPEVLFNYYYNNYPIFNFNYELSNTGLAIYLDAIKIMKENAWPKVTYNITPKVVKTDFMETAYDKIHTLVHINDYDLKFENVVGYISGLELDLDKPWEDTIEIKNYKTKFEDLFTSIVASTVQIQKNSNIISNLSSVVTSNGQITADSLQSTLLGNTLQLAYSQNDLGTFSVENNRILAQNSNGAVVYTTNGIFTSTEKDEDGNYIWNTGLLPSGISANSITSGRINTNLINIYSDDNLRLQLNKDGLFAYKSWFSNSILPTGQELENVMQQDGADPSQYVVHNSDGLFLVAKKGATPEYQEITYMTKQENNNEPLIINVENKDYELDKWPIINQDGTFSFTPRIHESLTQDINRVEISWDGLKLRNWDNEVTFYADPNTGDLILGGTLIENSTYLTIPEEIMNSLWASQNIEPEGAGENENNVENSGSQTFEDYIIQALQDTENESVRYLRPDVAAIKMNKYINIQSDYTGGIISNNLGLKYTPILKNLKAGIQNWNQSSLPNEPAEFEALYLLQDIIENGEIVYNAGNTIWYTGDEWKILESNNINIGTGGSLNLLGANINIGANSELNLLSGGKFNAIAAEEVLIATAEHQTNGVGDGTPDLTGSYLWMHNKGNQQVLDIGTTGSFNLHSGNFIIDSTATGQNPLFQILKYKNNDESQGLIAGLQFLANGTLNVTGIINAIGGYIGGWNISDEALSMNRMTSGEISFGTHGIKFGDALIFEPAIEGEIDTYTLTLNNVNFPENLLDQISYLSMAPRTTTLVDNLPVFEPDKYANGTLGVYYTDGIQTTTVTNYDFPVNEIIPVIHAAGNENTEVYHEIDLRRVNIYGSSNSKYNDHINLSAEDKKFCRVGVAHTHTNYSGIRVFLYDSQRPVEIESGTVLKINFKYKDRNGSTYDQINLNTVRAGIHKFVLFYGNQLIGQVDFTHPYMGNAITEQNLITTETNKSIELIINQTITVDETNPIELIAYCYDNNSLIYIKVEDITITSGGTSSSDNYYGLFLKSAGVWIPIGTNNLP